MIKVNIFFGFKLFVTVTILTTPVAMQAVTARHVATTKVKSTYTTRRSDIRDIIFMNDLSEVAESDLLGQKPVSENFESPQLNDLDLHYLKHFEQIPIIVKAEDEYQVKNRDAITIKTKHAWELSVPKVANSALLSLNTIKTIVLDHFIPKRGQFMDEWVLKPLLTGYQKVVAPMLKVFTKKEASTTVVIMTEIESHYKKLNFSDILLDLDKLHTENKLDIKVDHDDQWAMRVTISQKTQASLPNKLC